MSRARERRVLAALGVVVACWAALGATLPAARGGHTTADEPQYLLSALSLAEDRDLDIADERADERYRPFHRAELPVQEAARDDGSRVSPHDPLLPAFLAVPMGIGGWVAAKLALALVAGALAVALAWVAIHRFRVPRRVAVVVVGACCVAPPLAVYGTQVYPELPAALVVTIAIGALTGALTRVQRWVAVACIVALPWLAVKYVPVAIALVVFGGFRLARTGRVADATRAAAALVVAAAAFAVAHLAWYGGLTPYASGDHFVDGQLTVVGSDPDYMGRATRLVGLLVDRDFGLAAWHPLYLLAVPALVLLVRRRPPGWSALALVLAAGWCNASFVALTMHGWWFPGRQVVVVLPALVLALAWFVAQVPRLLPVVVALGGLGASVFAWFVVEAAVSDLTIVVDFESMTHPVVGAWRALLPDYRRGALVDWSLHAAWLAAITVTIRGVWRGGAPSTPDPSRPTAPSDLSLELHRSPSS